MTPREVDRLVRLAHLRFVRSIRSDTRGWNYRATYKRSPTPEEWDFMFTARDCFDMASREQELVYGRPHRQYWWEAPDAPSVGCVPSREDPDGALNPCNHENAEEAL